MIPRIAHFVFGLAEQEEPFCFLQYASIESCRRVLEPERIYFHHRHLPWGPWWDRVAPHLTLVEVDAVPEVLAADYSGGRVPDGYRYAHHSDFLRLDALVAHGGIYADIDTIFLRPFPEELFSAPFVIGREPPVVDNHGVLRPSLCNALMLAEPGARFARAWRDGMAAALDGSWSNHSGFLSQELSTQMPGMVRIEPEATFFPIPPTPVGLARLLGRRAEIPEQALSVHLWAHLWWNRDRRDFSSAHGGRYTPAFVRGADTTLAELTRPYVPDRPAGRDAAERWSYLSFDEDSGYGEASRRCIDALEGAGIAVSWTPFEVGHGWGHAYQPAPGSEPAGAEHTVVAHLVPEYVPLVRARRPDAFLIAHTAWETDRIPGHWRECLAAADLIVVPSRFSAEAMAAGGVAAPVAVVGHVAAVPSPVRSAAWADVPDEVLVFYTIAEWNERKAVFCTIEAYLRAFSSRDRVLLIVKTSPRDRRVLAPHGEPGSAAHGTTAWALAQLLAAHEDPPAVRLVTRTLSGSAVDALHRRGDCFVSLARGEGWGLGAFDAAARGNPVVTTAFGGQLEYLAGSPLLVRCELTPVVDPAGSPSYVSDQRWAEPDVDHAAELLGQIAADPRYAIESTREIAARIRRRYAPAAIAAAFRAAVEDRDRSAPAARPATRR